MARASTDAALRHAVQQDFQVALIDEFQDTDALQWRLFEAFFTQARQYLFLIGDPKQAIYRFRGADIHTYLRAAQSVPATQRFTLDTNYRSDAGLINAVNDFFARGDHSLGDSNIPFHPVHAHHAQRLTLAADFSPEPLQILYHNSENAIGLTRKNIAQSCARHIQALLHARGNNPAVQAQDVAVLVMNHIQADLIANALKDLETPIPSVRMHKQSVFTSAITHDVLIVLRALLQPANERKVRAAAFTRFANLADAQESTLHAWVEQAMLSSAPLQHVWRERSFALAWQQLLSQA